MTKCNCLVEVDDVDMATSGIKTTYVIRYCNTHNKAFQLEHQLSRAIHALSMREDRTNYENECIATGDKALAAAKEKP